MNITLLVNYDLASLLALRYLCPALQRHQLTVYYTQKTDLIKHFDQALIELTEFEKAQLSAIEPFINFSTYQAQRLNNINKGNDLKRFQKTQPDLVISVRHMSILKEAVVETAKFGVINLHSGLLPEYQGVMATYWAMKDKQTLIGTSLHFIEDRNIDTGSIIARSNMPANYQRSYLWNVLSVYKQGCENIIQTVEQLNETGSINKEPQQGNAQYYSYPQHADLNETQFQLCNSTENIAGFAPCNAVNPSTSEKNK